ncbi:alpha/beta hydrolase [Dongia soli]|uniref:Alpha/beta hydrolase n=1 Tax=Dongia soli TaxID=600628 RepID=A0ABU5E871_9PROT|nr:alpha/beta hydrolase [Dongia soli]MDY0882496.1 alpha/beta hydrolase [Dongia soli]
MSMSFLELVLLAVAAIYLVILLSLFFMQRRLIFPASQERADLAEIASMTDRFQAVSIEGLNGARLTSWFAPATRNDGRTIIYFHGNAGHIGGRVERVLPYLSVGYGALLVGYPGYGGNPGKPSEQALYAAARANLDFLERQDVDASRLILFGESLGTAVAIQMAIERPAAAIILEAPLASIYLSAWARYPYLAYNRLIRDKFASIDKIGNVRIPLLLIHGERDMTTAVKFGRSVFERANEPKFGLFPTDAGHNDLMQHGMPEAVLKFLGELPA